METQSANADSLDSEITCDYLVPLTVRVNVDTGEALEVWLHLEEFQSGLSGWFVPEERSWLERLRLKKTGIRICMRNAFGSEIDYAADGESEIGDKALAIADRVQIINPEFPLYFEVEND